MVKIQWLAQASFLIEGSPRESNAEESNGAESKRLRIITDPYDPKVIPAAPVTQQADIVIRSSDDDDAHCYVDSIPAGYELITATEVVDSGATAKGLDVTAIWAQESLVHKDIPRDNAMYRFTLDGITISHMGDVGNFLADSQMAALAGTDVLLALAGGPPTIDLDDLYKVIQTVQPRVVIPMHYRIPGKPNMLPVTELTGYFAEESVKWLGSSTVELSRNDLPEATQVYVLEPALAGKTG